ncbi:MAG: FAD-dependent oxidoreductase [Victivallaceae bacterium]|nr:FAD-dependent oxidoreductase [Victivallaceae bacterium]
MDQTSAIDCCEKIPVRGTYDVIVAGGGVAGVAAALAARRDGRTVLLLEKTCLLGGLGTIGLVNYFVPLCNGRGVQIIRGMAEEFLLLSAKYSYDTIPEVWRAGQPQKPTDIRYVCRYSPQIFALVLTELLRREGVDLSFDSQVSAPVMEGSHCRGVIVQSKSGREFFPAGMIVDATGDADVLRRAGVPVIQGKNFHTYYGHSVSLDGCRNALQYGDIGKLYGAVFGGESDLYGRRHPQGMPPYDGTTRESVNDYLISNQLALLERIKEDDRRTRDLATLPTMCQFRTTCCIKGSYTLKEEDKFRHFEDSVGAICDFDRRDYLYEIPYRAMVDQSFDNLIAAGRCVSGEGYGWDVLRVIPPAILSGEAAGFAASLALRTGSAIGAIRIADLQSKLAENAVDIHFDDKLIPSGNAGAGERVESEHI